MSRFPPCGKSRKEKPSCIITWLNRNAGISSKTGRKPFFMPHSENPVKSGSRRLEGLDVIRGLAAIAVFLHHLCLISDTSSSGSLGVWKSVWEYGFLGVPVFFVLSGVCVAMAWSQSPDWLFFATKRIRRIFPAYWGSLLLVLALACFLKLAYGTNDLATFQTRPLGLLATATLATAPASTIPTINWVYWTLSYEVAFYFTMACVLLAPPDRRVITLAIVHVVFCLAAVLFHETDNTPFFFIKLWPLFGAGAAVFLITTHQKTGVFMLVIANISMSLLPIKDHTLYWVSAATTCIVCFAVLKGYWNCGKNLLSRFGVISYSLYLIHVPLGVYVGNKLLLNFRGEGIHEILRQLLIFSMTCLVAAGFYTVFEKPFITRRPES
jgi:peptidoglycan/LPS O-acetylase OafA/YrhL